MEGAHSFYLQNGFATTPNKMLLWVESKSKYEFQPNDKFDRWAARSEARKILRDESLATALKDAKEAHSAPASEDYVRDFMSNEDMIAKIAVSDFHSDPEAVKKEVRKAVTNYMSWSPDPDKPDSFTIQRIPLAPSQPGRCRACEGYPRLLLSAQGGSTPVWTWMFAKKMGRRLTMRMMSVRRSKKFVSITKGREETCRTAFVLTPDGLRDANCQCSIRKH